MKKVFSIRTLLICLIFYFLLCWKMPFYIMLLGVDLPRDAIVLKRQVSLTDVCYWHILAEVVFVSNLDYDNIKETIWKENRNIMGETMDSMDCLDWSIMSRAVVSESCCASCVSVKKMDELAARHIGYQNWYCVSLSMMGKALRVFIIYRIVLSVMIFVVMSIVFGIRRKRKR